MDLCCKECGVAFSSEGNFCSRCGSPRGGEQAPTAQETLQGESAPRKLGLRLPHAKLKAFDTLSDPNFDIEDFYSLEEIDDFYPVLDSLFDLWDQHGPENAKEALVELGEAGSSAAWRVLATLYELGVFSHRLGSASPSSHSRCYQPQLSRQFWARKTATHPVGSIRPVYSGSSPLSRRRRSVRISSW